MRFEKRFGPKTRLLVATEGILTARLQRDPLLEAFRTVVLDEFHERSLHADLALALSREAWELAGKSLPTYDRRHAPIRRTSLAEA